jgi:hypothetical protein
VEDTLDMQKKYSLQSNESRLWHEADPKMGPEERKASRKENKMKVKEKRDKFER